MRLINADDVMEMLTNIELSCTPIPTIEAKTGLRDIPTAYDVDKVVKQLEECKRIMESPVSQDCYNEECKVGDCTVCAFEKAIEIVKAEFERCGKRGMIWQ